MRLRNILLVSCLILFSGRIGWCGDHLTYKSSTEPFTIHYPADWKVIEQSGQVFFIAPASSEHDQVNESVNVTVKHGSNPPPLDALMDLVLKKMSTLLENFTLLERSNVKVDREEARSVVYAGGSVKLKQYCFYKGSTLYTLTYTAAKETYGQYFPQAEAIMTSIDARE